MGTFKASTGKRYHKANIDANIRVSKFEFVENLAPYCQQCGRTDTKLSISHIISVNVCQNEGKAEQAWNKENFELLCIPCHAEWENKKVLTPKRKIYIEKYFPSLLIKYL